MPIRTVSAAASVVERLAVSERQRLGDDDAEPHSA